MEQKLIENYQKQLESAQGQIAQLEAMLQQAHDTAQQLIGAIKALQALQQQQKADV